MKAWKLTFEMGKTIPIFKRKHIFFKRDPYSIAMFDYRRVFKMYLFSKNLIPGYIMILVPIVNLEGQGDHYCRVYCPNYPYLGIPTIN